MKIEVSALDFCPDNCPYAEVEIKRMYGGNEPCHYTYTCNNTKHCQMLYDHINKQKEKKDV